MASHTWPSQLAMAINGAAPVNGVPIKDVFEPVLAKSKEDLLTLPATPAQVMVNLAAFYLKSNFTLQEELQRKTTGAFELIAAALNKAPQRSRR